MKYIFLCLSSFAVLSCGRFEAEKKSVRDHHVHIMSDSLVAEWQAMGIPFSHKNNYYSNIDSILRNNGAQTIDLISMAHVYGSDEFYQGDDAYEKVKRENNYVNAAAKKHSSKVASYFSIDPLEPYAMKEARRCYEELKMNGMKFHFSASQVYLTENAHLIKIKPLFKYAADNEIPILLHFDNWHPKFGKPDVAILVDSVLADIPALELTIAHLGGSGGFNEKIKNVINAFIDQFENKNILDKHTVWFDISAVALDEDSQGISKLTTKEFKELNELLHKLGLEHIVFGTDYPLYEADAYLGVLEKKVGLTKDELRIILNN